MLYGLEWFEHLRLQAVTSVDFLTLKQHQLLIITAVIYASKNCTIFKGLFYARVRMFRPPTNRLLLRKSELQTTCIDLAMSLVRLVELLSERQTHRQTDTMTIAIQPSAQ